VLSRDRRFLQAEGSLPKCSVRFRILFKIREGARLAGLGNVWTEDMEVASLLEVIVALKIARASERIRQYLHEPTARGLPRRR
jgi:hypothetical protein